jgi:3-hydroxyisobutyrate dehydrogenase-like beta-hydroxyacid dehydrogenase
MSENGRVDKPTQEVIAVLHPGEMGAVVAACLVTAGHKVLWVSAGRSEETIARAKNAGLADAGTIDDAAVRANVIVSICPPHAALDVATAVSGFRGCYVDANAIAPQTADRVATIVRASGATYVDGGIIGPPPVAAGTTRLFLSGEAAGRVGALFDGTALDARVVTEGGPYGASAVKMAYAAWTKGSAALLLAARELAEACGVSGALLSEWGMSQPALANRLAGAEQSAAKKGWRWIAEMEEIATTMSACDLPPGFHLAAAEIYRRAAKDRQGEATES